MRKTLFASALLTPAILFAGVAAAKSSDNAEKYVFAVGSYVEADDDRAVGKAGRLDLGLGREIAKSWYGELTLAGTIFDGPATARDLYSGAALFNLQWAPLSRGAVWSPFLDGGVGVAKNEDVGAIAQAGFGVISPDLSSYKVRLRMQARASYDDSADGALDYIIGAGLEFPIGQKTVVQTVERVVEKIVEKEVYRAPLDADGDGVADSMDRCPRTMAGSKVDMAGCTIIGQAIKLEGVNFATGSDRLAAESFPALDAAVAALRGQPAARVIVKGHTDASGSAENNMRLSQQRAEAVKRYFIANGIDAARITATGYGETKPIASNDSKAGRASNRRVEFEVTK